MTVGIYGIFCSDTGECLYVGQSKDVESRYYQHIKSLRNGNHRRKDFVEWFKACSMNPDKMIFKILEETPDSDFEKNKVEIFWFKELQPRFFGKVPSLNDKWTHSDETRKKIAFGGTESHKRIRAKRLGIPFEECPPLMYEYKCQQCSAVSHSKRKELDKKFCSRECASTSKAKTSVLSPELIHELYHVQKLSLRKIASRFNMSHVAVTLYMDNNNIPKRDKNDKIYKL